MDMQNANRNHEGIPFAPYLAGLVMAAVLSLGTMGIASAAEAGGERLSQTGKATGEARETREFTSVTTDTFSALRTEAPADVEKNDSLVS